MFQRLNPSLLKYSRTSVLSSTAEARDVVVDDGAATRVFDDTGAKAEVGTTAMVATKARTVVEKDFMV